MFKKIISGVLVTGAILASMTAFACGTIEDAVVVDYVPYGNGTHQVGWGCGLPCDSPYTVNTEDCTYQTYYIEDEDTWCWYKVVRCKHCKHEISREDAGWPGIDF